MIPTLLARSRAAITAAFYPDPPQSQSTQEDSTAQPRVQVDPIDALVDGSSLLALAEAIARKIPEHRAAIEQDGLHDPAVSQEVCRFTILYTLNLPTQTETF